MPDAKVEKVGGLYKVDPSPLRAGVGEKLVWQNLTDGPITVELPDGVVSDVMERLDIQARASAGFSRNVIGNARKDHKYKIKCHHQNFTQEPASADQATEVEATILIVEAVPRGPEILIENL